MQEFDKWCEEYVNDEQTKKIFGEWANYIAKEKGKREGISIGVHDVAQKMLKANMPKKTISELTGLSLKELKNL